MKPTSSRPKIVVGADGRGVVGHAGARMLADLADATSLSAALSETLSPLRQRDRGHDPGRVAVDLAVMLAGGGETITDLAVLRNQPELFDPVASDATAWRVLDGIDTAALALRVPETSSAQLKRRARTHEVFRPRDHGGGCTDACGVPDQRHVRDLQGCGLAGSWSW